MANCAILSRLNTAEKMRHECQWEWEYQSNHAQFYRFLCVPRFVFFVKKMCNHLICANLFLARTHLPCIQIDPLKVFRIQALFHDIVSWKICEWQLGIAVIYIFSDGFTQFHPQGLVGR
jgi:hypothetical protein